MSLIIKELTLVSMELSFPADFFLSRSKFVKISSISSVDISETIFILLDL